MAIFLLIPETAALFRDRRRQEQAGRQGRAGEARPRNNDVPTGRQRSRENVASLA